MENASKALIIAGAILLSILLISLGIMIFTQAQDVVSGSGMTEAEISSFNQKFSKYEGNMKGTMVKSLIGEVLSANAGSEDKDDVKVTVNDHSKPYTKNIKNNNTYNVVMETGQDGRINNIKIYVGKDNIKDQLDTGSEDFGKSTATPSEEDKNK